MQDRLSGSIDTGEIVGLDYQFRRLYYLNFPIPLRNLLAVEISLRLFH